VVRNIALAALLFQACDTACPRVAESCPGHCDELTASRFDTALECRSGVAVVGCWDAPEAHTADIRCIHREKDASSFLMSSTAANYLLGDDRYRDCTVEEHSLAMSNRDACE
jgi:hypothetical protein